MNVAGSLVVSFANMTSLEPSDSVESIPFMDDDDDEEEEDLNISFAPPTGKDKNFNKVAVKPFTSGFSKKPAPPCRISNAVNILNTNQKKHVTQTESKSLPPRQLPDLISTKNNEVRIHDLSQEEIMNVENGDFDALKVNSEVGLSSEINRLALHGLPPIARAETMESFGSHSDLCSLKKQHSIESYENGDEKLDTGSEKLDTVEENRILSDPSLSRTVTDPGFCDQALSGTVTDASLCDQAVVCQSVKDNTDTRSYKLAISQEPMRMLDLDIGEKKTQSLKLFPNTRQKDTTDARSYKLAIGEESLTTTGLDIDEKKTQSLKLIRNSGDTLEENSSPEPSSVPTTPQGKKSGKFSYVRRTSSFKQDASKKPRPVYKNELWNGRTAEDLPSEEIASYLLSPEIFASYSGPDCGLVYAETGTDVIDFDAPEKEIAGATNWTCKNRKAYGICVSLYDQHPIKGTMSGDPIADSFAICARRNSATLIVADGVNWGEKSRLAARCAVYGAMKYLSQKLFQEKRQLETTRDAIRYIRESFDAAHQTIIEKQGGLTTLCVALVLPMKESRQFAVCSVNVGDSFCFVFSKRWGIRELSVGSHDIQSERDIRDAGGALGPVDGKNPELNNLTCSVTFVDPGDIVFLTSDGISDNFDPVVTKIAVAMKRSNSDPNIRKNSQDNSNKVDAKTLKPEMLPHERHQYSVKEMERLVHEFELVTEIPVSAQELAGAMVQHVCLLTDPKRKVLENPELYGKKLRSKERKRRDSAIVEKMSKAPGKLDHATIVAYECGVYRGEELENYEYDIAEENVLIRDDNGLVSPKTPPTSPTVYESAV